MPGNKQSEQQVNVYLVRKERARAAPNQQSDRLPKRHIPTKDGPVLSAVPPLPDGHSPSPSWTAGHALRARGLVCTPRLGEVNHA